MSLSQIAHTEDKHSSKTNITKLSGGNHIYEKLFEKWEVLSREVEESKKILDTRCEKLSSEA